MRKGEIYRYGDNHMVITDMVPVPPAGLEVKGQVVEEYAQELCAANPALKYDEVVKKLIENSKGGSPLPITRI